MHDELLRGGISQEVNTSSNAKLEDLLLSKGLISKDQLEVALKELKQDKDHGERNVGEVLVELGFITSIALSEAMGKISGTKSFQSEKAMLDVSLFKKLPKNVAMQHKIAPISINEDVLNVATPDIYNIVAFDQIKKYFDKNIKIEPMYAEEAQIKELLDRYYVYEMSIDGILKEIEARSAQNKKLSGEEDGYVNPTVRLVEAILSDAVKRGASDIHFEPELNFVRLRYRIDGILVQRLTFHKDYWSAIVVRIKIVCEMNIAETRVPQDGRMSFVILGRAVDFRVSTHPTIDGENIVARILDRSKALLQIDQLGFSEHNLKLLKQMLIKPEGIIIVTGPTGCGKTTTLYSVLQHMNTHDVNIMTLEDPIEYELPIIRQSWVKEGKGMTFANGIRSMLRQDPDIIFVGEVRDQDTATMTIRASMTGHLVFTTLHTNDAFGSIPRMIDLGIKQTLLAGSIICCIAQRLVRRLCENCKVEYAPNDDERKLLGLSNVKNIKKIFKRAGCAECSNVGYRGRVAIHEILPIDKEIDEMIVKSDFRKNILEHAAKIGYISMTQDAVGKILLGLTDIEEAIGAVDFSGQSQPL